MQEEETLPQTPQGCGAKLIRPGVALDDIVSQCRPHVVDEQIRKQIHGLAAQSYGVRTNFFALIVRIWRS